MSSKLKKSLAWVAVTLMGFSLAGCGQGGGNTTGTSTGATGPIEGGSIVLDTDSNFKDFDPALAYFTTDTEVVPQVYEQLVTYQGSSTDIIGDLAESYNVSKDGKTYTFHLRKGVKFTNGDAMTAQSFIDEFERVLGKGGVNSPGEGFIDPIVVGSTAYHNLKNKTGQHVSGITAPDPYTLKIQLTQPEAYFLEVMAMPFFSAVDQKFITKVGNAAFDSSQMMGTGPFVASQINANGVVLKKNTSYWGKDKSGNALPYLDQVKIRINKNDQVDALNFQQGQTAMLAWVINGIPSASLPTFRTNPNLKKTIQTFPENANYYLGMNVKTGPFTNQKLRLAMEYAINKTKLAQLSSGKDTPANQDIPPGIPGYVKNLPADVNYTYNPAKARQLLAEAGYKPGQLTVTLTSQNSGLAPTWDQSIQYDLQQVGINCKINMLNNNTFYTEGMTGSLTLFIGGWYQDFPDPYDFLMLLETDQAPANNMTWYSNPQVDAWLKQLQTSTNPQQRIQLSKQITVQFLKDAPWVPLCFSNAVYAIQPWVHGYYFSPALGDPLQYIWIDKGHSQTG
ncbi:ABC transporter substrate-binding protein [Alicyclobacillus ferrooxydans]|uniref:Solute-binding protein family 5 domain-containing protein n=1 Tax=Alicyclobacillus ferrooxydans TaxID=471514 RepID=A0A0P9GU48_9BACL|nr:ABC transporter substrate-binding protein [Alicyclobacillus ferrooxydans]KPV44776.1 hypothetical protein AN477_05705 [Alicyclobacillus ferrooxydans]